MDGTSIKLVEAQTKLSTYNVRNFNKRQKRLENKYLSAHNEKLDFEDQKNREMQNLQQTLNDKEQQFQKSVHNLDLSSDKIKELKSDKHKLQKRLCGCKISLSKTKCVLITKHEDEIVHLKNEISKHNKKITKLEQLNVLLENDQIIAFQNGKYVNEIRECIMSLLIECNVSMNKVNSVISIVLKKITGVIPQRLPSNAWQ